MTQGRWNWYWKVGLMSALAVSEIIASEDFARAQVAPDRTLGVESSVVKTSGSFYVIEGGATRGRNLFHSFAQFSVPTNGVVYFNNASDVQNIISRVTGSSVSNINGSIKANAPANLFLLNPNGIIFGSNASLSIGGSFLVSTASSLNFADGTQFSATAPQATPLLTMSVPIGLQFGATPGSILNQSQASPDGATNSLGPGFPVGLQVQAGQTLALVGGDVTLKGGNLTASSGRIELGSVAGNSLISLNPVEKGWEFGYEGVQNFQNVRLTPNSSGIPSYVDASGEAGGNIHLQGRHVIVTGGTVLSTTMGSQPGGNLTVTASDTVELISLNTLLFTQTSGSGDAGNITINTGQLLIQDGAQVTNSTVGEGSGGQLTVNASNSVKLIGAGAVLLPDSTEVPVPSALVSGTAAAGNGGKITISTGKLIIQDEAKLSVESSGIVDSSGLITTPATGAVGDLSVTAHSIYIDNRGAIIAESLSGEGGNITLQQLQNLQLRHNSEISTTAGGSGNGGNINIDTGTLVTLENSNIVANAFKGRGGSIQIITQGLFRSPDSEIKASSQLGTNGTVQINTLVNNPSQGLVTLPIKPVNIAGQIAQGCPAGVGPRASKFVVTGRGGLPPDPTEALRSEPTLTDLGTTVQSQETRTSAATSSNLSSSKSAPLVEAQGWVTNAKGEVVLVAQVPTATFHIPWLAPTICQATKTAS